MTDGESLSKNLSLEEFRRFRDYVHQHAGIYLEDGKLDSLRISLITRATRLEHTSLEDYFRLLVRDEEEFKELLNLVTINETSFFRFPGQFEVLQAAVVPEILSHKPVDRQSLRVWSAGCSTGEEPYSIGISLLEAGSLSQGWDAHILGTDVSSKALGMAQRAYYSKKAVAGIPREILTRYFEPHEDGYRVRDIVRGMIDFQYQNLIKEPYPATLMGNWDVIFCRNVTIYFRLESTKRVVSNFYESLNEGGYLFIGHSETLSTVSESFIPTEIGGVFLYRKPWISKTTFFPSIGTTPGRRSGRRSTPIMGRDGLDRRQPPQRRGRRPEAPTPRAGTASTPAAAGGEREVPPLEQARAEFEAGRPERGHALLEELLEREPGNTQAVLLAGYAHADAGRYEEAVEACERALAIDPMLPQARYILGVIYLRAGQQDRALAEFKRTIYIDPDFAMAHLNTANVYKSRGRWEPAVREYGNALRALRGSGTTGTEFLGGFDPDVLIQTIERSLIECRKAMGMA